MNESTMLTIKFLTEVKGLQKDAEGKIDVGVSYKQKILEEVQSLLAGNLDMPTIYSALERYKQEPVKHIETYNVEEVLNYFRIPFTKGQVVYNPDNLMHPSKFYYHQQLQVTPPPPTLVQRKDGSFEASYDNEPFYLEMRDCYTVDDLLEYFYQRMNVLERMNVERDKGAMKHLLKSYDLDLLLHLIDEAYAQSMDRGMPLPKEPFGMRDYLADAILLYEARKNTCFEGGLNRVIPRTK